MLLKSAPIDKESEKIIEKRTNKSEVRKKAAQLAKIREIERRNQELKKSKRPRRKASAKGRAKKLAAEKKELEYAELLGPMSD